MQIVDELMDKLLSLLNSVNSRSISVEEIPKILENITLGDTKFFNISESIPNGFLVEIKKLPRDYLKIPEEYRGGDVSEDYSTLKVFDLTKNPQLEEKSFIGLYKNK